MSRRKICFCTIPVVGRTYSSFCSRAIRLALDLYLSELKILISKSSCHIRISVNSNAVYVNQCNEKLLDKLVLEKFALSTIEQSQSRLAKRRG